MHDLETEDGVSACGYFVIDKSLGKISNVSQYQQGQIVHKQR